jgi:drug/metabolite transporter (DMT)-like permease
MKLSNTALFIIPSLIWGSTWFVIKFQLGVVPPLWSVSYRFLLAGIMLLIYCKLKGINLSFNTNTHLRMAMQGALLFGFNYLFTYIAELEITSALMSVSFSLIMFLNIMFSRIFLGRKSTIKVLTGALLGVVGTFLIFFQELKDTPLDILPVASILIGFAGVTIASLGNVASAANQSLKIPVISSNAFGMLYGGLIMAFIALSSGSSPTIELTTDYLSSLVYLSVFGSIIAFGTYLTLIGNIGPEKAAYVLIVIPAISLIISTIFEGYNFELYALGGLALIFAGNMVVMRK